jgi:multiple sugar transport system permease protein
MRRRIRWRVVIGGASVYMALIVGCGFILLPIVWMFSTALKTQMQTFQIPVRLLPDEPTFAAFIDMWSHRPYLRYLLNSLVVSMSSTVVALVVSSLAAYALSRFRFRGNRVLLLAMMSTQMVQMVVLVIPYFIIMSSISLYDTLAGLVVTYIGWVLPYSIWILKGYLDSIPLELDEAAVIDGCSPVQVYWKVIVPISVPGIVAAGMLSFMVAWNEFTLAYVLISSDRNLPIGVGIAFLFGEYSVAWNELMAAGLVAAAVPVLVYVFASKYLVSGLTAGALK